MIEEIHGIMIFIYTLIVMAGEFFNTSFYPRIRYRFSDSKLNVAIIFLCPILTHCHNGKNYWTLAFRPTVLFWRVLLN